MLQVIDLSVPDLVGSPVDTGRPFPDAAFSPDSSRLYVAEYREGFDGESGSGILWVLDVEVWEGYQHDLSQMETPPSIALGENKEPVALAMAADGRRLYVAVFNREGEVGTDNGEIHVINTDTHENEGLLASVPEFLQDIALTPDGRQAVVTAVITGNAWANFVYIVDTVKGSVTPVNDVSNLLVPPLSGEFTEVSISSDGQRAFVVDENNEYVAVIDINRRIFTNVINLGGTPGNIAITPMGDRIYVPVETTSSSSQNNLASIPVNLQLPTDWTVTSGAVTPFCFGSPYDRLPILGLTPVAREVASSPTAMSQVAPVAACVYDFSFWGRSTGFRTVAEVIWLSDTCGLLRVDEVPIERITSPLKGQPPLIPAELTRHRAKFEAPEGATQAEIRFRVPAGEVAIVDQVSFRATLEGVANDDLQLFEEGQPANWTLSPETAHGFSLKPSDGVMELANDGFDDFDLTQTVPITAETPFTLQFLGQVIVPPVGPAWPQLELRWLKKDGAPTGTTATLELRSSDPDTSHTLSGTVPAEVTSVEVNLVVPGKTTLSVEKISLLPLELVRVPLKFMAQAPGELMVSNVHVAYDDTARAALPPIPEAGLCLPTAPDRSPGSHSANCCYCPCCGAEKEMKNVGLARTAAYRPAVMGECPDCNATLILPGARLTAARPIAQPLIALAPTHRLAGVMMRSRAAPRARMNESLLPTVANAEIVASAMPQKRAEGAALAGIVIGETVAMPSLMVIKGIGAIWNEKLAAMGIDSMLALARAQPQEIADTIAGISLKRASKFVEEAQEIMEKLEVQ